MAVIAVVFPLPVFAEFVDPNNFGKRSYLRNVIRSVYRHSWRHHILTPVRVGSNSDNPGIGVIVGVQGRVEAMTGNSWC